MPETKPSELKELLGKLINLTCGDLPKTYIANNDQIWKAFHLGRKYQNKISEIKTV